MGKESAGKNEEESQNPNQHSVGEKGWVTSDGDRNSWAPQELTHILVKARLFWLLSIVFSELIAFLKENDNSVMMIMCIISCSNSASSFVTEKKRRWRCAGLAISMLPLC